MSSSSGRLSGERAHGTAWHGAGAVGPFTVGAVAYLLLTAAAFFVFRPTTLLYFADYWEHRAIIEEVIRDGTQLSDPIYRESATSRQFTPWSLGLGYLARIAHIGVDGSLACGAMLVSVLFLSGIYDFGRTYFRHRSAPVVLLAVLTCGWGVPPLIWTGFYALRSQLHGNYYPASLVFALTFLAWAQVARLLRAPGFGFASAAGLAAIVLCSVLTHQLNAAFLIAGALGLVLFEPEIRPKRRAGVTLVVLAGVAASASWPYYDPLALAGIGMARGQDNFNNYPFFFDPNFVLPLIWPALFGVLAAPGLLRERRSRLLVAAFVGVVWAYGLGGWADISVSHRFLAYVVLALHLMIVRAILDALDGRPPAWLDRIPQRAGRVAVAGALMLVATQVALSVEQLWQPWARTHYPYPLHPVDAEVRRVRETLPPGARLIAWDSAALVLPAFGVPVVAYPRPMVYSLTDPERQADNRRFFAAGVPTGERRAIAAQWGATHVAYLTNELPLVVQEQLEPLGAARSPIGPWRVIALPPPR